MSAIGSISSNYLQAAFSSAIQKQGIGGPLNGLFANNSTSGTSKPDNSQLSAFAQIVSKLQDLQQSDPAKFKQLTAQIATNLQAAAQTAQTNGNTSAAAQLNQIASDFTSSSQSGQLPSFKDLAQAVQGGHHGGHHHAHAAASKPTDSDGDNDGSTNASTSQDSANQALNQLLASLQAGGTQNNNAFDPASIIFSTLNSAGIGASSQ